MKSTRILATALAFSALVLSSCEKDRITEVGVNGDMPGVTDLVCEAVPHASKNISFSFDASKAVAAGASSFTVQLVTDQEGGNYDNYNASITQTVQASKELKYTATFTGQTLGRCFYVRTRANYPKSVFSEWEWLYDEDGEIARVKIGRGVICQEGLVESPYIYKTSSTSSAITVKWDKIADAYGYIIEYQKQNATEWTCSDTLKNSTLGTNPVYKILNLEQNVAYSVRAKSVTINGLASDYCDVLSIETREAKPVDPVISTAEQLAVLLGGAFTDGDDNAVYTLANDIDMDGVTFDALEEPFTQTLDGAGHKISNLKGQGTALVYQNEGTIKNLTIDETCSFEVVSPVFGPFAAINNGTVSGVSNKAAISVASEEDAEFIIGGIVGSTSTALSSITNDGTIDVSVATLTNGLAVAGIAAVSEAAITSCVNNGKITVAASESVYGVAVAGITGYCAGAITACDNNAAVSMSAKSAQGRSVMGSSADKLKYNPSQGMGGIAAYVAGAKVTDCNNKGSVSFAITKLNDHKTAINRNEFGGIVGSPSGNIENCVNRGAVSVSVKSSEGKAFSGVEYIVCAGGISGGEYYSKSPSQSATSIINCKNLAKISVDFDSSASNSTAGGIVGWPGVESGKQANVIQNCENSGDVTVAGFGKGRFGGINGGSGNIVGCKNSGAVSNSTNVSGSCLGGVAGYMTYGETYGHKLVNCENTGSVENNETGDKGDLVYTGGLCGAYANQAGVIGQNCRVAASVSVKGTQKYAGMVLGRYNGANSGIQIGTADEPCLVKGRFTCAGADPAISAEKITSGNVDTYATGNERARSAVGPVYVKFDPSVEEGEEEGGATLEAPKNLSVEIMYNTVTVSWDPVDGAEWYVAEYLNKSVDGSEWVAGDKTSETSYSFTGLAHATKYSFRVKAFSTNGSGYSEVVSDNTLDELNLAKPVVTLDSNETSITATWGAVTGATGYAAEYKLASADVWTAAGNVTEPTIVISGLKPDTAYEVRVKALGPGGNEGEFSDVQSISTKKVEIKYPYTVKTAEDLLAWIPVAATCSATDEVILGADIDLSSSEYEPISTFAGIFNGNSKTITVKADNALFLELTGTVKDLAVSGSVAQSYSADDSANGHVLAAIALISNGGTITGCTNKAAVSMTSTGVLGSPVVAGVAAYQKGGTFENNSNLAAVTLTHGGTASVSVTGLNRKPFVVTGGVIGIIVSATAKNCTNEGAVKVSCTNVPAVGARHYVGGVVGTPEDAKVISCVNKGAITADFTDATKAAAKQVWVGGVIGGRNGDVKTVDGAYVEGCDNYGTCTLIAENSVNNYLAGIGGQVTVEATGSSYSAAESTIQKIVNCHNYGKLIKQGAGGCRCGGISGGAATLENCGNEGEIVIDNISTAGAVGGLVGYPTQKYHPVTNSYNKGNITSNCSVVFAVGGLFGQSGNTAQNYSGLKVNCTISTKPGTLTGIVTGTAKTSTKTQTYGTADAPCKVMGTVNGTAVTADNMAGLLCGDGAAVEGIVTTPAGGKIDYTYVQFGE